MQVTQETPQMIMNSASKLETAKPPTGRLLHNAVFSRRNGADSTKSSPPKPLANLNPTGPLARIIHQTDKNGKQQSILTGGRRDLQDGSGANGGRGIARHLFASIWSAFSVNEQSQRLSPRKQKQIGGPGSTIELRKSILPPRSPDDLTKKCLVLDLDETLVHSSFRPTSNPDLIIPVNIDDTVYQVYVCKRPGAEEFLVKMSKIYEIVVYTASLSKYADPLLDKLDAEGVIRYRLYREHCVQYEGNYVKDLSLLDRNISQTIIVDNSPMAYIFHPRNAIGCSSFIDDPDDRELESISSFLTKIQDVKDVRDHLYRWNPAQF